MAIPEFQWLNTVLGNVKNSLHSSYHQFSGKHLPCYLGSSAIASIADLTWPPCFRALAGRRCGHRPCRIAS
jgi:hypothetical protein